MLGDLAKGSNWARGAEWMLRYCDARGWRGISAFEFPQMTSYGRLREIDAIIDGKRYQFKSWSSFYPSTFVRQMEKDFRSRVRRPHPTSHGFSIARKALNDPNAIRAAAAQALDDALARGTTVLSADAVSDIKDVLGSIIEVPAR